MANQSKEGAYEPEANTGRKVHRVLSLGLFSAASAVAGGLAVAWWYRKTLSKLQNPIEGAEIQQLDTPVMENEDESALDAND
jgi:hypothetical protein